MEKSGKPFFTIITSTLNVTDTIERCVKSVAEQTFRGYEHIIVDGASTDGTIEFLNSKRNLFSLLISEPDKGIYNAWNKALKHACGEWFLFLGADDILADSNVLSEVEAFITQGNFDSGIVYGDVMLVSRGTYEDRELISVPIEQIGTRSYLMSHPQLPPHPAVFHHKSIFNQRKFDESLKIASDLRLLLELLYFDKVPFLHIDRIINRMTPGGISSVIGLIGISEIIATMHNLKLPISIMSVFLLYAKTSFKVVFYGILGKKRAYRLIDFIRLLRGKPPLWN